MPNRIRRLERRRNIVAGARLRRCRRAARSHGRRRRSDIRQPHRQARRLGRADDRPPPADRVGNQGRRRCQSRRAVWHRGVGQSRCAARRTDRSSGAVWGNLTMPGLRPLGFDKTSVEARVDAGKDEGKLGATLSRSVPINQDLSVTLQNSYSVKQSLASGTGRRRRMPPTASIPNAATGRAGARLGRGRNGSAQRRSVRHHVLGRRRFIDRGHPVAQQAERGADLGRPAQAHDLDRGRRDRGAEEKHYRRIQANLVTRRQGTGRVPAPCPGICPRIVTVPPHCHVAIAALLGSVIATSVKGSAA